MRIIGCIYTLDNRRSRCWIPTPANCKTRPSNIRGETVREFYSALSGPILVGIEATGLMQWFLELMEELGIECRVGHPQKIRKAETRKQKHDRRDARLLLTLLTENRFPTIWMPSTEQRDLRTLLRHRHQWVRLRSRVQHTLQIDGTQPRSQARPLVMEPRGPARAAGVAPGSLRQRAAESTDDIVSPLAGINRRARPAGE
jgi:transposase